MKSKRTKQTRSAKRQSKLLLKLSSWDNFIDEAYQLESMLAKKPKQLLIEFVGVGEIPADTALLMRSMLLKRSAQTRIVTSARSSLLGAAVLVWLLGDKRLIREDAQISFRPAGPFTPDGVVQYLDVATGKSGVILKTPGELSIWRLELTADKQALCCHCTTRPKVRPRSEAVTCVQVWNYPALCQAAGIE